MQIRRLAKGDAEAACEIVRIFQAAEVGVDRVAEFLADEGNYLIAAYVDGEVAGYVIGYRLPRIDGRGPRMFLYDIEIAAHHRRRGIGRALVGRLKQICREQGFSKMFVLTNESNTAATGLYAATGGKRAPAGTLAFEYLAEESW